MNNSIIRTAIAVTIFLIIGSKNNYSQSNSEEINLNEISNSKIQNIPEHNITISPIKFEVEKTSIIKISIFNKKGEIIETVVDGEMEPGIYNVYFKTYENLESGEYYYTIEANGITEIRNAIVLK